MRSITAVLGVYNGLDRTKAFVEDFNNRFPDVPLSLSCIGSSQEVQDEFKRLYGEEVTTGTTERVSFSETWNAAILGVKTEKFVFLHNDMYLADDFFDQLEGYYLDSPDNFYVYTTVEPYRNVGFPRPGKILAKFGEDLEDFQKGKFRAFVKQYQATHRLKGRGYGFYLAGFTESLKEVGGFDYLTFNPMFCEDDDLLIRIRKKGYRLYTAPAAVVYHFGSKTTREIGFTGMSESEIEMNRRFARKWGFEARYLWETGYEYYDAPLETGNEKIGLRVSPEAKNVPIRDVLNLEPLVGEIACQDKPVLDYLKDFGLEEKSGTLEDCDIIITLYSPVEFNQIAYFLGDLRFNYKKLASGTSYHLGFCTIDILKTHPDQNRQDPLNYLSLQSTVI